MENLPEIFDNKRQPKPGETEELTNQSCQFTGSAFAGIITGNDIKTSMDGRGRALDNILLSDFEVFEV